MAINPERKNLLQRPITGKWYPPNLSYKPPLNTELLGIKPKPLTPEQKFKKASIPHSEIVRMMNPPKPAPVAKPLTSTEKFKRVMANALSQKDPQQWIINNQVAIEQWGVPLAKIFQEGAGLKLNKVPSRTRDKVGYENALNDFKNNWLQDPKNKAKWDNEVKFYQNHPELGNSMQYRLSFKHFPVGAIIAINELHQSTVQKPTKYTGLTFTEMVDAQANSRAKALGNALQSAGYNGGIQLAGRFAGGVGDIAYGATVGVPVNIGKALKTKQHVADLNALALKLEGLGEDPAIVAELRAEAEGALENADEMMKSEAVNVGLWLVGLKVPKAVAAAVGAQLLEPAARKGIEVATQKGTVQGLKAGLTKAGEDIWANPAMAVAAMLPAAPKIIKGSKFVKGKIQQTKLVRLLKLDEANAKAGIPTRHALTYAEKVAKSTAIEYARKSGTKTVPETDEAGNLIPDEAGNPKSRTIETGEISYHPVTKREAKRISRRMNKQQDAYETDINVTEELIPPSNVNPLSSDVNVIPANEQVFTQATRGRRQYPHTSPAAPPPVPVEPGEPLPLPAPTRATPTHTINGEPVALLEDGTFVRIKADGTAREVVTPQQGDAIVSLGQSVEFPQTISQPGIRASRRAAAQVGTDTNQLALNAPDNPLALPAATPAQALVDLVETARKKPAVEPSPEIPIETSVEGVQASSPNVVTPAPPATKSLTIKGLKVNDKLTEPSTGTTFIVKEIPKSGGVILENAAKPGQGFLYQEQGIKGWTKAEQAPTTVKPKGRTSKKIADVEVKTTTEPVKPPVEEPPANKITDVSKEDAKIAEIEARMKTRTQQGSKRGIKNQRGEVIDPKEAAAHIADTAQLIAYKTLRRAKLGLSVSKAAIRHAIEEVMGKIDDALFKAAYAKANFFNPDKETFHNQPILVEKLRLIKKSVGRTSRGVDRESIPIKEAVLEPGDMIRSSLGAQGETFKVIGDDLKTPGNIIIQRISGLSDVSESVSLNKLRTDTTNKWRVRKASEPPVAIKDYAKSDAELVANRDKPIIEEPVDVKEVVHHVDEIEAAHQEFLNFMDSISKKKEITPEQMSEMLPGNVEKPTNLPDPNKVIPMPEEYLSSETIKKVLSGEKKQFREGEGRWTQKELDEVSNYLRTIQKNMQEALETYNEAVKGRQSRNATRASSENLIKVRQYIETLLDRYEDLHNSKKLPDVFRGEATKRAVATETTTKLLDVPGKFKFPSLNKLNDSLYELNRPPSVRTLRVNEYANKTGELTTSQVIRERAMQGYDLIEKGNKLAKEGNALITKGKKMTPEGKVPTADAVELIKQGNDKLKAGNDLIKQGETLVEQTTAPAYPRRALGKQDIQKIAKQNGTELTPEILDALTDKYKNPEFSSQILSNHELLIRDLNLVKQGKGLENINLKADIEGNQTILSRLEKEIKQANEYKEPVNDADLMRIVSRNTNDVKAWEASQLIETAKNNVASETLRNGISYYLKSNPGLTIAEVRNLYKSFIEKNNLSSDMVNKIYKDALSYNEAHPSAKYGTRDYTKELIKDYLSRPIKEGFTETTVLLGRIMANEMTVLYKALRDKTKFIYPTLKELVARLEPEMRKHGWGKMPPKRILQDAYDMAIGFHEGRIGRKDWGGIDPLRLSGGKLRNETNAFGEVIYAIADAMASEIYLQVHKFGKALPKIGDLKVSLKDELTKLGEGVMVADEFLQQAYKRALDEVTNRVRKNDMATGDHVRPGIPTTFAKNANLGKAAYSISLKGDMIALKASRVQGKIIKGTQSWINDVVDKATGKVTRVGITSITNLLKQASRKAGEKDFQKTFAKFIDTVELNRNDPARLAAAQGNGEFARALRAHDILMEDARQSHIDFMKELGYEIEDNWGINETGYIPHTFEGRFKIVEHITKNGKPDTITHEAGMSFADAMTAAKEFMKQRIQANNPNAFFDVTTMQPKTGDPVTRVSGKALKHLRAKIMQQGANGQVMSWGETGQVLRGIIGSRGNRRKFRGAEIQRAGVKGWIKNYPKIMKQYAGQLVRSQELTRFLRETEPILDELRTDTWAKNQGVSQWIPHNLVSELESYRNTMMGHTDKFVKSLSATFNKVGFRNVSEGSIVNGFNNIKAGLSWIHLQDTPAWLGQALQPLDWVGSSFGLERTAKGYAHAYNPINRAWYEKHGFVDNPTRELEGSFNARKISEKAPFSVLGRMNQRISYKVGYDYFYDSFKNKEMYKGKPALLERHATEYAQQVQILGEGLSSPAGAAPVLQRPTMAGVGLYRGFGINSLVRMANIIKADSRIVGRMNKAKAISTMLGVKGVLGGIKAGGFATRVFQTFGTLMVLEKIGKKMGLDADNAKKFAAGLMYGILGWAEIDASSSFSSTDVPRTIEDTALSALGAPINTALSFGGSLMDLNNARKKGISLHPQYLPGIAQSRVGKRLAKAYDPYLVSKSKKQGTALTRLDEKDRLISALFGKTTKESTARMRKNTSSYGIWPFNKD